MSIIVVPSVFPWTMFFAVLITIFSTYIKHFIAGPALRKKYFNEKFMSRWSNDHSKAFPEAKPIEGGYPDNGEGRYASNLSYKEWVEFCNHQRVHRNFIEQMPVILINLMIGGVFVPKTALFVSICVFVGRVIYTHQYITKGSNSRFVGVGMMVAPLYALTLYTYL